jgi:uncharacterized protein YndB with AHSA1/START domain
MPLFKPLVLTESIEIKTTPGKIWEFFTNLEKNYKTWHPEDHVIFQWTKGKPMEAGSNFYAEEYVLGKIKKFKGTISEVVPYRKIVFRYSFPLSLVSPGFEWQIEPKGSSSVFTAISYVRAERIMRTLVKYSEYKGMETLIEVGKKHVKEEGENLKKILEKKNH